MCIRWSRTGYDSRLSRLMSTSAVDATTFSTTRITPNCWYDLTAVNAAGQTWSIRYDTAIIVFLIALIADVEEILYIST